MKRSFNHGISAIIVVSSVYNKEEEVLAEALESLKDIADEIVVVHDGPCKDNSVNLARKYTKKVYITKHKGRSAFNFITALKKNKYK